MKLNVAIIYILCFMLPTTVQATAQRINNANEEFDVDLTGFTYESLATLNQFGKAIEEYYQLKLWYRDDEKILKIKKDESNNVYYVTVQVQTFEGPHNPPYGEETITFQIKGSEIKVTDYKHRDIPRGRD